MPCSQAASISSNASGSLSPWPNSPGAEPTPPKLPQPSATRGIVSPLRPSRRRSDGTVALIGFPAYRRALARRRRSPTACGTCETERPRLPDDGLDRLDRLQLRELGPAILPVRRYAHVRAELVRGLVDQEPLG